MMFVSISSDAAADLAEGYWFYERQSPGLGGYFRSCLIADIESLAYYQRSHWQPATGEVVRAKVPKVQTT